MIKSFSYTILVYFLVKLCSRCFCNYQKNVLDPNGPYISAIQAKIVNVGLKYSLKERYIILIFPKMAGF